MRSRSRLLLCGLVGGVVLWCTALAATPYTLRHGAAGGALVAGSAVYLVASAVCHQRADRSFHPWGVQLPVCGRCAGLYAGALLGICAAGFSRRRNSQRDRKFAQGVCAAGVSHRRNSQRPRKFAHGLPGEVRSFRGRTAGLVLAAAALPTAATVLLEAGGLVDPGNLGRAASAVPLGVAACAFVAGVIRGKVH
ncbi:MAG: DUF2085 domain-containing protein [Acidobacteria bacterium]|nr:DUF2085 domain-containing protein [Acidobacteriota bacterium]